MSKFKKNEFYEVKREGQIVRVFFKSRIVDNSFNFECSTKQTAFKIHNLITSSKFMAKFKIFAQDRSSVSWLFRDIGTPPIFKNQIVPSQNGGSVLYLLGTPNKIHFKDNFEFKIFLQVCYRYSRFKSFSADFPDYLTQSFLDVMNDSADKPAR